MQRSDAAIERVDVGIDKARGNDRTMHINSLAPV